MRLLQLSVLPLAAVLQKSVTLAVEGIVTLESESLVFKTDFEDHVGLSQTPSQAITTLGQLPLPK